MTPNNYTERDINPVLMQDAINSLMDDVEETKKVDPETKRFIGKIRPYDLRGEFTGLQQKKLNGFELDPFEKVRIIAFEKLFNFRLRYSLDYELEMVPNENCISHTVDDLHHLELLLSGDEELTADDFDDEQIEENMNGGCYIANHWMVDGSQQVHVEGFQLKSEEELKKVGYEQKQTQPQSN